MDFQAFDLVTVETCNQKLSNSSVNHYKFKTTNLIHPQNPNVYKSILIFIGIRGAPSNEICGLLRTAAVKTCKDNFFKREQELQHSFRQAGNSTLALVPFTLTSLM